MVETFQKYGGSGLMLCWFVIAWLYLFIKEKKTCNRIMFVYAPAIVLLLFFNPLFYKVFSGLMEDAIYFRFLWLLPITLVLGYTVIEILNMLTGRKKYCFGIVAVALIMVSGKLVYTSPLFSKAENEYHVPQTVVDICDAIMVEGREVMAMFPEEFVVYVRQYTPSVCMPYGREILMGEYNSVYRALRAEVIDLADLAEMLKNRGCHYLIITEDMKFSGKLEDYDYVLFDEIDGYLIYRDTTIYIGL